MNECHPLPLLPQDNITPKLLNNYFRALINRFFKILPIWEEQVGTVDIYMRSLMDELLGCKSLIMAIREDALFISLVSILQFLIDSPECEIKEVKREVFSAIDICNKLSKAYACCVEDDSQ